MENKHMSTQDVFNEAIHFCQNRKSAWAVAKNVRRRFKRAKYLGWRNI
jgi:hypothetical protein